MYYLFDTQKRISNNLSDSLSAFTLERCNNTIKGDFEEDMKKIKCLRPGKMVCWMLCPMNSNVGKMRLTNSRGREFSSHVLSRISSSDHGMHWDGVRPGGTIWKKLSLFIE